MFMAFLNHIINNLIDEKIEHY